MNLIKKVAVLDSFGDEEKYSLAIMKTVELQQRPLSGTGIYIDGTEMIIMYEKIWISEDEELMDIYYYIEDEECYDEDEEREMLEDFANLVSKHGWSFVEQEKDGFWARREDVKAFLESKFGGSANA